MSAAPRLPADLVAMMAKGVSVIVGSRDAALRPSIMRALGSQVQEDGRAIVVYLARPQSRQLLQDLATTGRIAVVFSQPSTHRSVQLKASQVEIRPAQPADAAILAAYLASMEEELGRIGLAAPLVRAVFTQRLEDVVAVRFTPEQAFDQTPGPRAGVPLGPQP